MFGYIISDGTPNSNLSLSLDPILSISLESHLSLDISSLFLKITHRKSLYFSEMVLQSKAAECNNAKFYGEKNFDHLLIYLLIIFPKSRREHSLVK